MKRKTAHEWALLIEAQQQSQLTAKEFCRQQGLNDKYFSLRKGRYMQEMARPLSAFVEASVLPGADPLAITLHWQSIKLELPPTTSSAWIAGIMKALVH